MFNKVKSILNIQIDKMQNFNSENEKNILTNSKKNADFSNDLNRKISSSQSRISQIRKSIQNTKL